MHFKCIYLHNLLNPCNFTLHVKILNWSTLRIHSIRQPHHRRKKGNILHFTFPTNVEANSHHTEPNNKKKKSKYIWLKAKQSDIHLRDNNNINHDCSKLNCMIIVISQKTPAKHTRTNMQTEYVCQSHSILCGETYICFISFSAFDINIMYKMCHVCLIAH